MHLKHTPLLLLCMAAWLCGFATDKAAYRLFDTKGKVATYDQLLQAAAQADVVLFGEIHNNPIAHWLQLELSHDLLKLKEEQLVLGAEMFEADNQLVLDEYLSGAISEKSFETECRLWDNYPTDYKPLLQFAQQHGLQWVATNVPRRYASVVARRGLTALDSLSPAARQYIAPLPLMVDLTLPGYAAMMDMGSHDDNEKTDGNDYFPKAQAIKDATMAHFICQNRSDKQLLLHFNGAYHSNNQEGIAWYLRYYQPRLRIVTISTTEQTTVDNLDAESVGIADFVIAVPNSMTKTY